ncbi:hypothetical protein [Kitasatospora viridis]|uniref:hypothetical protein n=1 Tax=Kitasatospora viridis TaxID=281105 RepID=UPI0011A6F3A6|nr:hypothetical protein [Kitasatospora viridis]
MTVGHSDAGAVGSWPGAVLGFAGVLLLGELLGAGWVGRELLLDEAEDDAEDDAEDEADSDGWPLGAALARVGAAVGAGVSASAAGAASAASATEPLRTAAAARRMFIKSPKAD